MSNFLKKTNFAKKDLNIEQPKTEETVAIKPKLGGGLKSPIKSSTLGKPGSLLKKKAEPKELDLEAEETPKEEVKPAKKPLLGKKGTLKTTSIKKEEAPKEVEIEEQTIVEHQEDMVYESMQGASEEEIIKFQEETPVEVELEKEEIDVTHSQEEEEVKEEPKEEKKATSKKKTTTKKKATTKKETKSEQQTINFTPVDETKRVSLEEMDAIMRPIVAPTTELWEQEKKDILEALNAIKVEQDMNMSQVKTCLSDLDELKFEILPRQHDAETMYDGTKQNYDTVKAVAIAKGNGSNAEARKAEGILACQNFVTPSGAVVDLHQYMLLIEERYKFYEKISEGVNFKKYSLVNYNNAIKAEKEGK